MATERLILEIRTTGTKTVQRDIGRIRKEAQGANKTLALLRAGLVIVAGARVIGRFVELADTLTNIRNRLRLVTTSTEQLTAVQAGLFKVSQETRADFEASAILFSRLTRSTQGLGLSYQDLLDITRGVNQAVAISGATAQEARNSLVQFSQGLASGTLRGDELRSVVEQFPRLAEAIGKEFGVAGGALAAFAKENDGVITTERIIKALRNELPELATEFEKVQITAEGAFTRFNNALLLFVGGITNSVRLGEKLDVVLQAIARNLPEITVALLAIVAIGAFNLLTTQLLAFQRHLLGLAGFIVGPFVAMGSAIISGPIRALQLLTVTTLAAGNAIRSVATGQVFIQMAGSIRRATASLIAFGGAGKALRAFAVAQRSLIAGFVLLRTTALGATAATKAFLAAGLALRSFANVLKLLTTLSLRFLLTLFLNPVVLGFAAIIIGIVGAFLLFRKVVSDFIPEGLNLGKVFDTFAAVVLTAINTVTKSWRLFGPALADIFISSINFILRKATDFFNFFIEGINNILGFANRLGADFGQIDLAKAFQIDNQFKGSGAALADQITTEFQNRLAKGGNAEELKSRFNDLLGFFRDFLPPDLTEAMENVLKQQADLGAQTNRTNKALKEAKDDYDKLRESLDPLAAGLKEMAEAQKAVDIVVKAGTVSAAEGAETLNLLARRIVGLDNAQFELNQNLKLAKKFYDDGKLSAAEYALAVRQIKTEASGAAIAVLQGTFPLLDAQQKLQEQGLALEQNQAALKAQGVDLAEARKRLARAEFGLGETIEQTNERIAALRANQDLLGLSSSELEAEIRKLNIAFLEGQRDAGSGAQLALEKYIDDVTNAAKFTEMVFTDAFKGVEDAIVKFVETGKFEIDDLFRNIAAQLLRLGAQQLTSGIGGFIGGIVSGGSSGFGIGGPSSAGGGIGGLVASFASSLFGAQHGANFTVGANTAVASLPGIDNRLIAFRARDNEDVTVTPRGGQVTQAPVNQVFNVQTRDADSFKRSQTQIQNRALAGINQARRRR